MSVVKYPENWTLDDCIEDCHYSSRFCVERDDGVLECPAGWRECEDRCRRQFSS